MRRLFIFLAALSLSIPAHAGKYSPPGMYEADYVTLDNGMGVVLSESEGAHNTAIRLVVKVGTRDFPHGKRETAHFLEHLLFAGTSKHSEEELEEIIETSGGTWNAQTRWFSTVFEIDIFSGSALPAISLLHEIISDSTLTPEKVELTREIIHRESDGRPSKIRRWLYSRGIGKSAYEKAYEALLPGSRFEYKYLETPDDIEREEIVEAYRSYYVPNNMTLIVVGEFDRIALMKRVGRTFGNLKERPLPKKDNAPPPYPGEAVEVTGTFSPIIGSDGSAGIAFRTDGASSEHFYALWLLRDLLDTKMYDTLRIKEGLSYGPGANFHSWENFGTLFLTADVDRGDMDDALLKIRQLVDETTGESLDSKTVQKTRKGMLLRLTRSYQTNGEKADYYANSLHELATHGGFVDAEEMLGKVSTKDARRAANQYFSVERAVIVRSRPAMTYTTLYMLLIFGSVLLFLLILRVRRRRKVKRRRGLEFHR